MAFKSVVNYCYKVAERADKRGMHATAETIRETLEDYQWAYFEPTIAKAIDRILIFQPDAIIDNILPQVAENSNLTLEELLTTPHIHEYVDYIKHREQRYREIECEAAIRYREKYGERAETLPEQ